MSFPFSTVEPAGSTPPSLSRPTMQQNNLSIYNLINVDHVTFNNGTGGQHEKMTFPGPTVPPVPTANAAVLYPAQGIQDTTTTQLFYLNAQAGFPISCVRAFGTFNAWVNATYVVTNNTSGSIGITSSGGQTFYTIQLVTGTVTLNKPVVVFLTSSSSTQSYGYTYTQSAGQVVINGPTNASPGVVVSFLVMWI